MRNKTQFIILILSLFFLTVFVTAKFSRGSIIKEISQEKKLLVDSIKILNSVIKYHENLNIFSHQYEGYQLSHNLWVDKETGNDLNEKIRFDSILQSHPRSVVVRYTEIGCNECSDMVIDRLNKFSKDFPTVPIYILADFTNYDAYLQWRKVSNVKFDVFFLKKGSIDIDDAFPKYSYIFWVDKNLIINKIFLPNSGFPEMVNSFLKSTFKLYLENNKHLQ